MWQVLTNRRDIQWLLWLDCDALITKLRESMQDLLKSLSVNSTHDLVVDKDLISIQLGCYVCAQYTLDDRRARSFNGVS